MNLFGISRPTAAGAEGWPDWPLYGLVDDIRPALADLLAGQEAFALATLVGVEGPAPRPAGSQMLVAADGSVRGYVSGGCVEADLALRARPVMETGAPELVRYGGAGGNWDIRLSCGSHIGVFLQRVMPGDAVLGAVVAAREERRVLALVIDLETGALRALKADTSRPPGAGKGASFVKIFTPPLRLLIIGADPAVLALVALARPLGMQAHLNRPSGPAAPPPAFAPDTYHTGPPDAFLDAVDIDPWTAVVCMTHDPDLDHAVLRRALSAGALYAGALGSRRYRARRLERLRKDGVPDEALSRLKAPVGLDIGACTAPEIALAVLADIVASARGRNGPECTSPR